MKTSDMLVRDVVWGTTVDRRSPCPPSLNFTGMSAATPRQAGIDRQVSYAWYGK